MQGAASRHLYLAIVVVKNAFEGTKWTSTKSRCQQERLVGKLVRSGPVHHQLPLDRMPKFKQKWHLLQLMRLCVVLWSYSVLFAPPHTAHSPNYRPQDIGLDLDCFLSSIN